MTTGAGEAGVTKAAVAGKTCAREARMTTGAVAVMTGSGEAGMTKARSETDPLY